MSNLEILGLVLAPFAVIGLIWSIVRILKPKRVYPAFNKDNFPPGVVVILNSDSWVKPTCALISLWSEDNRYVRLEHGNKDFIWYKASDFYEVSQVILKQKSQESTENTEWLNDPDWWKKSNKKEKP